MSHRRTLGGSRGLDIPRPTQRLWGPLQSQKRTWSSVRYTVALALLQAALGSGAPEAQGLRAPGKAAAHGQAERLDQQLAARLGGARDTDPLPVIITVKPGAKRGLLRALQAQGASVSEDFTIIEAFAGQLPAGLVRALQKHSDASSSPPTPR